MADAKSSETPKIAETGKPVLTGLSGWLAFHVVAIGAGAVGYIWAFFLAIAAMSAGVSGVALGVAIETLIFSLGLVFLSGFTLFLLVNRKKLAALWAYILLGAQALFATVVSITTMFGGTEKCSISYSYYTTARRSCETIGLPAEMIIVLIGGIFVAWASALLIAYYFKKSQRVKLTLTK
jgi:hypothetical protein